VPLVVALAAVAWALAIAGAPLLPEPLAAVIYVIGSGVCHQRPERSFHLFDAQLPVCARCAGIYAGAAAGAALAIMGGWRTGDRDRRLMTIAAVPTVLTVVAEWVGLWHPGNPARALAGLVLGTVVSAVLVATLQSDKCAPPRPTASNPPPTPI